MPEQVTVQMVFNAKLLHDTVVDQMIYQILKAAGVVDPSSPSKYAWPCDDFTFDWGDDSFEMENVQPGWLPPASFNGAVKEMGFDRYWLCYAGGSAQYVFVGESEPFHEF
jgi:hypothetical protein